jgi:dTMP kinase
MYAKNRGHKGLRKGFFITFEGGEGAGKTTLLEGIYKYLLDRKIPVVMTREPGSTKLGEEIRNLLLHYFEGDVSIFSELCLYLASRAQHIKEIILPALRENKIVLCDRFNDSTIAYQGHGRDLGMEKVKNFCNFVCQDLKPDITFYLDLDPKIGVKRIEKGLDRLESENISFHEKVRKGYLKLAKEDDKRIFVIDGSKTREEVLKEALEILDKKIF